MADFQITPLFNLVFKALTAFITCTVGALIGIIAGAIKGQTTETGFVRGAGVGAISGAIVALQARDMIVNGEPMSKVALLQSLLGGKLYIEWTSAMEMSFTDMFNVENNVPRGLSEEDISELPVRVFYKLSKERQGDKKCNETNCVICLQDLKDKEEGRELPSCKHVFHVKCIDEWLVRQGSCPVCRRDVTV